MKQKVQNAVFHPASMAIIGLFTGFLVKLMDVYCYTQHFGVSLSDIFSQGGCMGGHRHRHQPLQPKHKICHGQHFPILCRDAGNLLPHCPVDQLRLWLELYQGMGSFCLPLPPHGLSGQTDPVARLVGSGFKIGGFRRILGAESPAGVFPPLLRSAFSADLSLSAIPEKMEGT